MRNVTRQAWAAAPARARTEANPASRDQAAAAHYIAAMAKDLGTIARRNGLDALAYLLELARLEADGAVRPASGE